MRNWRQQGKRHRHCKDEGSSSEDHAPGVELLRSLRRVNGNMLRRLVVFCRRGGGGDCNAGGDRRAWFSPISARDTFVDSVGLSVSTEQLEFGEDEGVVFCCCAGSCSPIGDGIGGESAGVNRLRSEVLLGDRPCSLPLTDGRFLRLANDQPILVSLSLLS